MIHREETRKARPSLGSAEWPHRLGSILWFADYGACPASVDESQTEPELPNSNANYGFRHVIRLKNLEPADRYRITLRVSPTVLHDWP